MQGVRCSMNAFILEKSLTNAVIVGCASLTEKANVGTKEHMHLTKEEGSGFRLEVVQCQLRTRRIKRLHVCLRICDGVKG
ncbi:hypothetical protein HOLleu_24606 [Holothuria leucospilota]|uniref:Uncharacterized protein n=1 Tax=Holothuria leucospilota TaxID=206669 RepID=A0A9Q1BRE6_HOLLE|nr:hypothetical protein HOLleu_24606 [Holothuria leucospilota]